MLSPQARAAASYFTGHMRWEPGLASSDHETYRLCKDGDTLLKLSYNPFSSTARVECHAEQRVFQIRREGLRKNRLVIRNEYGVRIGELGQDDGGSFIEVNGQRFRYRILEQPHPQLALYRDTETEPIIITGLEVREGKKSAQVARHAYHPETAHPGLLTALCWYMFLPVAREKNGALS